MAATSCDEQRTLTIEFGESVLRRASLRSWEASYQGRRQSESGNNSAVEYPLGLKLIGLHIEDVSFATDQTERHLEVGNTGYENYDSSAKRRLLVSLGIFLRIYYKGGMLGEQSASLPRASVLAEGQPAGLPYALNEQSLGAMGATKGLL
ncbi:hypothetical protein Fot_52020 [Forsythia ovata]|uniref:Uncharacterized protein n=1 Tax=Forsythia ovata TaxID=205694 RepID=A0ABD1PM35_9LAMI